MHVVVIFILLISLVVVLALGAGAAARLQAKVRVAEAERAAALADRSAAQVEDRHDLTDHVVEAVLDAAALRLDDRLEAGRKDLDMRKTSIDDAVAMRNQQVNAELKGLRDQVNGMNQAMAGLRTERAQQHGEFVAHLERAALSHRQLADTTSGLREALASPTARGSWGERTADDLLRRAGLVEGVSYRKQQRSASGSRPDFTILLPENWELNMDVKFPADNYLRSLEATSDHERDAARKRFLSDVRNRMKELAARDYITDTTLDYVLLFIPNESIYSFIHEHQPDIVDVALDQKVILCSPFTLFGVLAVVRQSVELFRLEQRGDDILRSMSDFTTQWEKFGSSIDLIEKRADLLTRAVDDLSSTRRNQLQRQVDKMMALGTEDAPTLSLVTEPTPADDNASAV
jgi:DNA recombination protein RmuC